MTCLSYRLTLSVTCRSAACSSNRDTIVECPFWQAMCSAVDPFCKEIREEDNEVVIPQCVHKNHI